MIAPDTQTLAKAWFYQFSWGFSTVPATGTADERDAEMLVYPSLCASHCCGRQGERH